MDRLPGTIARLFIDKGFGFLKAADGVEYFFHRSAIAEFLTLVEGDAVTFEPTIGPKGPRAESVARA
jgi:cold shock CspA family protein